MTETRSAEVIHELERLAELYHRDISEGLMALYLDALEFYGGAEIIAAMRCHIRDPERGKFFPLPADIIRGMEGSPQNRSLAAWTRAIAVAEQTGQYASVDFGDPVLHLVIEEMGGWRKFLFWPEREDPFKQKEFRERYQAWIERQQRGRVLEAPRHLMGISEATNRQTGYGGDTGGEVISFPLSNTKQMLPKGDA